MHLVIQAGTLRPIILNIILLKHIEKLFFTGQIQLLHWKTAIGSGKVRKRRIKIVWSNLFIRFLLLGKNSFDKKKTIFNHFSQADVIAKLHDIYSS